MGLTEKEIKERKRALRKVRKPGPNKWLRCDETAAKWKELMVGMPPKEERPPTRQQLDMRLELLNRPPTPENFWYPGWISPKKKKKGEKDEEKEQEVTRRQDDDDGADI